MSTYRAGTHHGVTICVEGDGHTCGRADHDCARGHLVAVVVNGDQALAERLMQLLNADQAEPEPTGCGCPVRYQRARIVSHTRQCCDRAAGERLARYLDAEYGDEMSEVLALDPEHARRRRTDPGA